MASPELERRIARIRHIQRELQELYRETHPGVTAGTVGIWLASGGLALAGVALAVPTGGVSLLLSVAGVVVFLIDMARQVQATARTREHRRRAHDLEQELLDHLEFIRRFGGRP